MKRSIFLAAALLGAVVAAAGLPVAASAAATVAPSPAVTLASPPTLPACLHYTVTNSKVSSVYATASRVWVDRLGVWHGVLGMGKPSDSSSIYSTVRNLQSVVAVAMGQGYYYAGGFSGTGNTVTVRVTSPARTWTVAGTLLALHWTGSQWQPDGLMTGSVTSSGPEVAY